jgi:tetratricopeptide (TPR) repeat protein
LNPTHRKLLYNQYVRLLLVVIAVGLCVWTIKSAASHGASRFLTKSALTLQNLAVAQTATQLAPTDAQAHRANAVVLNQMDATAESALALEQALALRPADYSLWLSLGRLRDKRGDTAGALAAFNEAVKWAPYYAQPRWQRGNVLLRSGQYEAAFSDLNLAAQSNPALVPNIIDLAWSVTRGDYQLTQELVELNSDRARIIFAGFLATHGRPLEAIQQSKAAGRLDATARRELVQQLLLKRSFAEAFQLWAEPNAGSGTTNQPPAFYDGGFEAPLSTNETAFGWRVPDSRTLKFSVDPSNPHSGARSLQIQFGGESPAAGLLSQLLIVQSSTRYRINFAARSEEIITGGRPIVVVNDAGENGGELGKSSELDKGTSGWRTFSFEFTSTPQTQAVYVAVSRAGCSTSPCPIFGSIGLDSFSIEHLK